MEDLSGTALADAAGGALPIRVYNALNRDALAGLVETGPRTSDNGRVITRAIKVYVDGALGSRGAALLEPYSDAPETDGLLLLQEDEAKADFTQALEAGIQIAAHGIGDRGNRLLLDWFEETFAAAGVPGETVRWRIEHAQILDPADIPRFAAIGVIPSMQPSHAIGDLYFAPDRLGPDRLDGAYAWASLIKAGSVIAGGSDAPVEKGDPRIEFYAAVARKGLDGFSNEDWRADEAVSREAALKMFTLWPAIASFQEDELGTIEVGKKADFTVFSGDIMTIAEADILTVSPLYTIVDGEVVFSGRE